MRRGESMNVYEALRRNIRLWPCYIAIILATLGGWYTAGAPAATIGIHAFGRYEIVLQEGTPVGVGEILGVVHRRTGLPEYPLMWGVERATLGLNVIGPGNRPLRLASAQGSWPTITGGRPQRFILERSTRQGEMLVLHFRRASPPQQGVLRIDLRSLERTLEGER